MRAAMAPAVFDVQRVGVARNIHIDGVLGRIGRGFAETPSFYLFAQALETTGFGRFTGSL